MEKKKPFYEQVAEKLIEQLKQGTAPWQKPWDGGGFPDFMPHNTITGRRYRGINNIWLQAQGRKDPRWMTYKQAASIGAQVRRGEKGTVVEYWKFTEEINKTDEKGREILGADGKPEKITVRLERPQVFHAVVFNAEQIDGLPPLQVHPLSWNPDERAENILKNSGASITHMAGDRAFYSTSKDSITLPLKEQFQSQSKYYEVALHELGHWTGHPDRLNRDLSHPFGSEGYAREELRAEIASLMLSQELGIPFEPGQHASYVGSWVQVLQDDPMEIMRAASDAEKIQSYVMAFEQVQEVEQKTEMTAEIAAQQNIDEASLEEEKRIIEAIEEGSIIEFIDYLAEEKHHENLTQLSQIISLMESRNSHSAFWQRHTKPQDENTFFENLNDAKNTLEEAIERTSYQSQLSNLMNRYHKFIYRTGDEAYFNATEAIHDANQRNDSIIEAIDWGKTLDTFQRDKNGLWVSQNYSGITISDHQDRQDGIVLLQIKERHELYALVENLDRDVERELAIRDRADFRGIENSEKKMEAARIIVSNTEKSAVYKQRFDQPLMGENEMNPTARSVYELAEKTRIVTETVEDQIRQFMPEQQEGEVVRVVSEQKVYVQIPYADKEQAKMLGARWDKEEKSWYIPPGVNQEPFDKWLNNPINQVQSIKTNTPATENILINVPYQEKNEARALGAKWDREQKSWYIPEGLNTELFGRWMPDAKQEMVEQSLPDNTPQDAETERQANNLQQEHQMAKSEKPETVQNVSWVYLAVPYEEKDEARSLGAKWDKANKSWFMEADNPNLTAASKWLPENQTVQTTPAMSPIEEFADKLREMGCVVANGHPFMDGQKHRIETIGDKKGERSGFYVAYLDGHPAGYIKNNRTGEEVKWKAKGYSLSPEEKAKLAAESAQKLQMREEQKKQAQEAAVERIKRYMQGYEPIQSGTPYLKDKGISPQLGIFTDKSGEKTYIPVYNSEGELRSMQYIQADGTKRFAKDSEQEGCMHVIGQKDLATAKTIILSEGYATAASIDAVTDASVVSVATFNSGNLPIVAKALQEKYPQAQFLVAGDDDLAVEIKQGHNPGKEKAKEAAKILNCQAVFPIFASGEQSPENKIFTDFNDLAQKSKLGKAGLAKQINEAIHAKSTQELQTVRVSSIPEAEQVKQGQQQQRQQQQRKMKRGSR